MEEVIGDAWCGKSSAEWKGKEDGNGLQHLYKAMVGNAHRPTLASAGLSQWGLEPWGLGFKSVRCPHHQGLPIVTSRHQHARMSIVRKQLQCKGQHGRFRLQVAGGDAPSHNSMATACIPIARLH